MQNLKRQLTSRVVKCQIDKFISNREHSILTEVKNDQGVLNSAGFVEILRGGMKSTNKETLRVSVPPQVDLSIHQDNGFSVFLWLITSKTNIKNDKLISYILKKGNTVDQLTPTIGITNNQTNLFVSLKTSKSKKETIFANKPLEADHFYSLAINFAIDYESESTEVSIYIDGKLDTQSTVQGEPIHNQGDICIGKPDSTCHGFRGSVADIMLIPKVLEENEVKNIHQSGLQSLLVTDGKDIGTSNILKQIFDRKKLIIKYAQYTNNPVYQIENLGLSNERMLEIVKLYDKEEAKNEEKQPQILINYKEQEMKENLKLFMENEDNEIRCYKILDNQRFINTILHLANNGEEVYELGRLIKIFIVLRGILCVDIPYEFMRDLCRILNCIIKHENEKSKFGKIDKYYINKDIFFTNLESIILLNEEEQKLIDEENAKYAKKEKKKGSIKGLYKKQPKQTKQIRHVQGQYSINLEEYKSFGNCIEEHEDLLLRLQPIKNVIDEEEEKGLKDYHSNYVIKSLYEKPKNLPGNDPDNSNYTILDRSVSKSLATENEEEDGKIKLNPEEEKQCEDFIQNLYSYCQNYESNYPFDFNILDTINKGDEAEKKIMEVREIENQKILKMESEKRKKEEEALKKAEADAQAEKKNEKNETNFEPKFKEDWADGAFEVVINHCYNCLYGHREKDENQKNRTITKTTRHFEYKYIEKFNEIGEIIKKMFPNAIVIGNLDEREYISCFDIYLRGTGLPGDEFGRYFIYRKKDNNFKFPSKEDVIDHLTAVAMIFGGTKNIERVQSLMNRQTVTLPITHEHPLALNEDLQKEKEYAMNPPPDLKNPDDFPKGTLFHPGKLHKDKWTCCNNDPIAEGCTMGTGKI